MTSSVKRTAALSVVAAFGVLWTLNHDAGRQLFGWVLDKEAAALTERLETMTGGLFERPGEPVRAQGRRIGRELGLMTHRP